MFDCIIIGAGIAGLVTARMMSGAGMNILIIDDSQKNAASRVAAGLVNPITGKRFQVSWRFAEFLHLGMMHYASFAEEDSQEAYLKQQSMIRLFVDEKEREVFNAKYETLSIAEFVGEILEPETDQLDISIRNQHGGFRTLQAHVFDYGRFLDASGNVFRNNLLNTFVAPHHIESKDGYWSINIGNESIHGKTILFCDGWLASRNPWLSDVNLQFDIVKGESCIIQSIDLPETDIISRGFAIIPIGKHQFRCAATFQWNEITTIPTAFGAERLMQRIQSLINCEYEILEQSAGLRPTMLHHLPFLGEHPNHKGMFMLGGLGTKGALYAPHLSQQLLDYFAKGKQFDEEMDISQQQKRFAIH